LKRFFIMLAMTSNLLGKSKAKNVTCTLNWQKIPYYLLPVPNYQLKTLAEQLCHYPHWTRLNKGVIGGGVPSVRTNCIMPKWTLFMWLKYTINCCRSVNLIQHRRYRSTYSEVSTNRASMEAVGY
jgi:hypothetical protein